jgi:hypothetical protein
MTITINGTTGIAGVDGSASTPAVQGADTNTGIFFPAADTIGFAEGGAEVARFDSSGNFGIGVTAGAPATGELLVLVNKAIRWMSASSGTEYGDIYTDTSNNMVFRNGSGATERARFTAGGYFKASNDGSYLSSTGPYHEFRTNANDTTVLCTSMASSGNVFGVDMGFRNITPNNTTSWFYRGYDSTDNKCIIYSSGTVTNRTGTYNSFSDLKLKQDIVNANSQWDDIKALRIVKYRLKNEVAADPNYPAYIGVIAQEVEQVSPGLIDNCVDQDTGEVTKAVKSSIIYMKAVKALQEAMDRIETLEAQNAAFEARLAALEAK